MNNDMVGGDEDDGKKSKGKGKGGGKIGGSLQRIQRSGDPCDCCAATPRALEYKKVVRLNIVALVVATFAVGLIGCGDSTNEGTDFNSLGSSIPESDYPPGSLEARMVTEFVDVDQMDVWMCSKTNGNDWQNGYSFGKYVSSVAGSGITGPGFGVYFRIWDDGEFYESSFDWYATGPNSLYLEDGSTAQDISSIEFSSPDAWTGYSSTEGPLDCLRSPFSGSD